MPEIILTIITGIVIAAVSALITVRLSLRKFRTERWWERKVDAYEKVIEALHNSKAFTDEYMNAAIRGQELSEERNRELRSRTRKASDEILKAMDVGAFLLSKKALERLKKYKKEEEKASEEEDWYSYLEVDLTATTKCLKDFIEIAKQDLKTH